MSILDQIGAKITDVSAGATQQAKNSVDIVKLNGIISSEKQKLSAYYQQIGEAYYAANCENPPTDYAEMFETVNASLRTIQSSQKRIEELKGIKQCPECGAQISVGTQFCPSCGKPVKNEETVVADDSITCSNCGNKVNSGARFCNKCGSPIQKA